MNEDFKIIRKIRVLEEERKSIVLQKMNPRDRQTDRQTDRKRERERERSQ